MVTPSKLAIVVHVYYVDLWVEIAHYLQKIETPFDVFITTTLEQEKRVRHEVQNIFPDARIRAYPNMGLDVDVVPFLHLIPELVEAKYLAVCKLHTKKGDGELGSVWLQALLQSLVGSNKTIKNISNAFVEQDDLGMVGTGAFYLSARQLSLEENNTNLQILCKALAINDPPNDWGFFAGSMFWINPDMLMPLALSIKEHSEWFCHPIRRDDTMEYALESVIGLLPVIMKKAVGLLLPITGGILNFVLQRISYKKYDEQVKQICIKPVLSQYKTLHKDRYLLLQTGLFSYAAYLKQFPTLLGLQVDLLTHYLLIGRFQGANPHPDFNSRFYQQLHLSRLSGKQDAFLHYVRQGAKQSLLLRDSKAQEDEKAPSFRYRVLNTTLIDWSAEKNKLRDANKVSIVIPILSSPQLIAECVNSLYEYTLPLDCFEIIIINNNSSEEIRQLLQQLAKQYSNLFVLQNDKDLNLSLRCNLGFVASIGKQVVFLSSNMQVTENWLEMLLKPLMRLDISAVYPCLLFSDGTTQCMGEKNEGVLGYPVYQGMKPENREAKKSWEQLPVTGLCMAVQSEDFVSVKGFDPIFINGLEDADLCLRMGDKGKRKCWYSTKSLVYHYEKRSEEKSNSKLNRQLFMARWKNRVIKEDDRIRNDELRNIIIKSGLFDEKYYLKNNLNVKNQGIESLSHFIKTSLTEKRNPSELFNTKFYLETYEDVKKAKINPLAHYILYGKKEKRLPLPLLDKACKKNVLSVSDFLKNYINDSPVFVKLLSPVDIIIPVYNNISLVKNLLSSIEKNTVSEYRLIIIDDCSSEEGLYEYLLWYSKNNKNVLFFKNTKNLGFVKTCNKAFTFSRNNIVLLNTDTEVPSYWLERLMEPIESNPLSIASTTPFSNSATICSFPDMPNDNDMYLNADTETIDDTFKCLSNINIELPTGVGFCMGLSKFVLKKIGGFDEESFGRGYGEENDWCQRAISYGYKNVHVTNLFVKHDHGKSFSSEEKSILIQNNLKVLYKKWPDYQRHVQSALASDFSLNHREITRFILVSRVVKKLTVIIDHDLGGGTTLYRDRKVDEVLNMNGEGVLLIKKTNGNLYTVTVYYKHEKVSFNSKRLSDIFKLLNIIVFSELILNSIVHYPNYDLVLESIVKLRKNRNFNLVLLLHDFYPICPSYTLLNYKGEYCSIPETEECSRCFSKYDAIKTKETSISNWKYNWFNFIKNCSTVVVFSESSKNILLKAYPSAEKKIIVKPHAMDYFRVGEIYLNRNDSLNIGVLGSINEAKGLNVVLSLANYISQVNKNSKIFIIGVTSPASIPKNVIVLGKYKLGSLKQIIEKNEINTFLMPSIWPETFSYVVEELILLKVPIVSFDIGAQGEKIREYSKGAVLPVGSTSEKIYLSVTDSIAN